MAIPNIGSTMASYLVSGEREREKQERESERKSREKTGKLTTLNIIMYNFTSWNVL